MWLKDWEGLSPAVHVTSNLLIQLNIQTVIAGTASWVEHYKDERDALSVPSGMKVQRRGHFLVAFGLEAM